MKNLVAYVPFAVLLVVLVFVAGYVGHGLWLVFQRGWEAMS